MNMFNDDIVREVVKRLRLLTESANRYIEDGSWIDTLQSDIQKAENILQMWDENYDYLEQEDEG